MPAPGKDFVGHPDNATLVLFDDKITTVFLATHQGFSQDGLMVRAELPIQPMGSALPEALFNL
jgi:hypothetical protein